MDADAYRRYIAGSRGEFTVAKDQNVRLRSGWFSDRSATYLAAGRPVVTQDTAFGNVPADGRGAVRVLDARRGGRGGRGDQRRLPAPPPGGVGDRAGVFRPRHGARPDAAGSGTVGRAPARTGQRSRMTQASTASPASTGAAAADGGAVLTTRSTTPTTAASGRIAATRSWLEFFGGIAEQIVARSRPSTVLDAGCAMGMVVEALRDRGVEAFGVDLSEYAIENVRPDVRPFCRVGSILDPFHGATTWSSASRCWSTCRRATRSGRWRTSSSPPTTCCSPRRPRTSRRRRTSTCSRRSGGPSCSRGTGSTATSASTRRSLRPGPCAFRRHKGPVARVIGDYERRLWWLDQDNRAQRELGLEQRNRLAALEAEVQALRADVGHVHAWLAAAEGERDAARAELQREREARWAAEYRRQVGHAKAAVACARAVGVEGTGDQRRRRRAGRPARPPRLALPADRRGVARRHPPRVGRRRRPATPVAAPPAPSGCRPGPSLWWLDSYPEFADHLRRRGREAHRDAEAALFDLRGGSC